MPVLAGDQIGKRWPVIKEALKLSAAPTADVGEEKLKNMLESLLTGKALCWMTGNKRRPRTVVVTTVFMEDISKTKNMLVYCAHGFEKERASEYMDLLGELRDYAQRNNCHNIMAYIWNDKMKKLMESYGAECRYTLMVYPLN